MDIEGFVLTGGASSRMGRDKASLPYRETTLGGRAAGVLCEITGRVRAVGGKIEGFPELKDIARSEQAGERAAIYGLHTALTNCRAEWAAVFACDLPFVNADLFQRLIEAASGSDCDAVVPYQPDGRAQPLAAIYRLGPCLRAVENCLQAGEARLTVFLARITACRLGPETYANLDPDGRLFMNVNTPDDYQDLDRFQP